MVLPGDQITNHGVPKDLVDTLEHYRPVFAHVLRNSDEARKRHAWQARKAQLAQNVQPTNGSTHYDRYDWQRELSVAYNKRRRSASPASSTSSALSYDGPRAEKRPRVDSRTSPCESAHDAQFEHGTPIQIAPTEDAPSKEVAHPPQNKEPTGTHMRSVRKPTIPYRNPSVEELQDAQLWMTFYRREVLEQGASCWHYGRRVFVIAQRRGLQASAASHHRSQSRSGLSGILSSLRCDSWSRRCTTSCQAPSVG